MQESPEERPSQPTGDAPRTIRDREVHYRGRLVDVVTESIRLPSGVEQHLEIVEHGGAVAVAPVDDQGRLVCVRQYRHAARDWMVEIPAGRLEPGEAPLAAAHRELEEETGMRAGTMEQLTGFYPAPGFCSEFITLFVARDLRPAGADRLAPDADEELSIVRLTPIELIDLPCRDAKSLVAAALLR
ncbi:MAG: NUDIX hydrolase [Planctomycetota bacterium]